MTLPLLLYFYEKSEFPNVRHSYKMLKTETLNFGHAVINSMENVRVATTAITLIKEIVFLPVTYKRPL